MADDFKYSQQLLDDVAKADEESQQRIQQQAPAPKKKRGLLGVLSDTFIGKRVGPRKEYEDL